MKNPASINHFSTVKMSIMKKLAASILLAAALPGAALAQDLIAASYGPGETLTAFSSVPCPDRDFPGFKVIRSRGNDMAVGCYYNYPNGTAFVRWYSSSNPLRLDVPVNETIDIDRIQKNSAFTSWPVAVDRDPPASHQGNRG